MGQMPGCPCCQTVRHRFWWNRVNRRLVTFILCVPLAPNCHRTTQTTQHFQMGSRPPRSSESFKLASVDESCQIMKKRGEEGIKKSKRPNSSTAFPPSSFDYVSLTVGLFPTFHFRVIPGRNEHFSAAVRDPRAYWRTPLMKDNYFMLP